MKIVLRSGTTSREATATLTFPDQPATAADPVEPESSGSGGTLIAAGAGIGILVLIAVVWLVVVRRRRSKVE